MNFLFLFSLSLSLLFPFLAQTVEKYASNLFLRNQKNKSEKRG